MRKTAIIAGLFLCAVIFLANKSTVHAETAPQLLAVSTTSKQLSGETVLEVVNAQVEQETTELQKPPQPVEHVIAKGETLEAIAKQHQTTWQRIYAKNIQIANPDVVNVGEKVIIPSTDEPLAERAAPVQQAIAPIAKSGAAPKASKATQAVAARGSSGGNTYSRGYCTWYAKSRRPDLPNNLGNANTWVSRASAQDIPTGSAPRAGAIGQQGNHVVYVERVNGDGSVTVSEMNYAGFGVVSSRTVPAGYFQYIY